MGLVTLRYEEKASNKVVLKEEWSLGKVSLTCRHDGKRFHSHAGMMGKDLSLIHISEPTRR